MKLYLEMTDAEYELFKKFKEKPKLEDHNAAELASALLGAIRKEGGQVHTQDSGFDINPNLGKTTTGAKLQTANFVISLYVEKY